MTAPCMQIGIAGTHAMTTLTYSRMVHRARIQRRRRRAELKLDSAAGADAGAAAAGAGSGPPAEAPPPPPHAHVLQPPPLHMPPGADVVLADGPEREERPHGRVATGGAGPVAESAAPDSAVRVHLDAQQRMRGPAVSMASGDSSTSAAAAGAGAVMQEALQPERAHRAQRGKSSRRGRAALGEALEEGARVEETELEARGQGSGIALGVERPLASASLPNSEAVSDTEGGAELVSALPATAEELEEQRQGEAGAARSLATAALAAFRKVWNDVREEPRLGFRCDLKFHLCP